MSRRSDRLSAPADERDVIAVVARAFEIMRCFGESGERLANGEVAARCKLPRSTVSRLTHTLTRMGHLVYLPRDGKYRIGPSAIAQSVTVLRHASARESVRDMIEDLAHEIPGTIGLTCPDGAQMVYVECARAYNAVALNSFAGTRISTARTAAGQAFAAALTPDMFEALRKRVAQTSRADARLLQERIVSNRRSLKRDGYVTSVALWNPHIAGVAVPVWSERHGTWLTLVCGALATTYGVERLRREVAPRLLELATTIARLDVEVLPDEAPELRNGSRPTPTKIRATTESREKIDELGSGTGRTRTSQGAVRTDGRRRKSEAAA